MHIDPTGHWTSEMYQDWNDFQTEQQVDAAERVLAAFQSRLFLMVLAVRAFMVLAFCPDYTWGHILFGSDLTLGLGALILVACTGTSFFRRLVQSNPSFFGVLMQMVCWLSLLVAFTTVSLAAKDELFRHRSFLCLLGCHSMMSLLLGYFPFRAHCFLYCPSAWLVWLIFHWMVDYCTMRVILSGFFLHVIAPALVKMWLERLQWQKFRGTRQLAHERNNLVAAQATLQDEKERSESMCRELAAEKLASQTLNMKLEAEKQSLEALLAMICDGSFWLARDGDTVVRSEKRFDAIMGCEMLDQSFRTHVASSEHGRLLSALQVEDTHAGSSVKLLSTSIQQRAAVVNTDLFIVDRRDLFSDLSTDVGYLVGLRLSQNIEAEALDSDSAQIEARDVCIARLEGARQPQKEPSASSRCSSASCFQEEDLGEIPHVWFNCLSPDLDIMKFGPAWKGLCGEGPARLSAWLQPRLVPDFRVWLNERVTNALGGAWSPNNAMETFRKVGAVDKQGEAHTMKIIVHLLDPAEAFDKESKAYVALFALQRTKSQRRTPSSSSRSIGSNFSHRSRSIGSAFATVPEGKPVQF